MTPQVAYCWVVQSLAGGYVEKQRVPALYPAVNMWLTLRSSLKPVSFDLARLVSSVFACARQYADGLVCCGDFSSAARGRMSSCRRY
jgi:hypothetical protein